jgi:hypothetical protein
MVVHVFDRSIAQLARREQVSLKSDVHPSIAPFAPRYVATVRRQNARRSNGVPLIRKNTEFVGVPVWGKIADRRARALLRRSRSSIACGPRFTQNEVPLGAVHREVGNAERPGVRS